MTNVTRLKQLAPQDELRIVERCVSLAESMTLLAKNPQQFWLMTTKLREMQADRDALAAQVARLESDDE